MQRRYVQETFDNGPDAVELKKNLAAEEKRVQKEIADAAKTLEAERKRIEKINRKAEIDGIEKNRVASLSVDEEKAEEKLVKRNAAIQKKRDKDLAHERRLESAQNLMNIQLNA